MIWRFFKWIFKTIISAILLICLVVLGINFWVVFSGSREFVDDINDLEKSEYVMILGASVRADHTPSKILKNRLDKGIEIYMNGKADKILMTGDSRTIYYDEVGVMKDYALSQGVPEADIVVDKYGYSTYESVYWSKYDHNIEDMIIVTQRYHLYRATYIAKKFDIKVQGVIATDGSLKRDYLRHEIRELLARDKDFVLGIIKPEPDVIKEFESLLGSVLLLA